MHSARGWQHARLISMIDPNQPARCRLLLKHGILPALALIGTDKFKSREAIALMLAIAMQESRIQFRAQIGGPAMGFYQFERGGGVHGVLFHRTTKHIAAAACDALMIEASTYQVYNAIQYQDVLASVMARLLLWTAPAALPTFAQGPQAGWDYYLSLWRPGKPHPNTWGAFWDMAWAVAREAE